MKKADELCSKVMICVTLIFLQFSSAFFWLLRVNLKKADELCRKAMICVNFNLPTVFISLFLVTKGDFKKLMNTVGKLTIIQNEPGESGDVKFESIFVCQILRYLTSNSSA